MPIDNDLPQALSAIFSLEGSFSSTDSYVWYLQSHRVFSPDDVQMVFKYLIVLTGWRTSPSEELWFSSCAGTHSTHVTVLSEFGTHNPCVSCGHKLPDSLTGRQPGCSVHVAVFINFLLPNVAPEWLQLLVFGRPRVQISSWRSAILTSRYFTQSLCDSVDITTPRLQTRRPWFDFQPDGIFLYVTVSLGTV